MKWLITGAAGFIGSNLARAVEAQGDVVVATDNFRRGSGQAVRHLDVRNAHDVDALFAEHRDVGVVAHLAGQVSMVASIDNPRYDFETNAFGTLNLLEAVRKHSPRARFLYAGTNKVYGGLSTLRHEETRTRYTLPGYPEGLDEQTAFAPSGPYACSKAAADTYVRDYANIYGLKTAALRQSSVYGERQQATFDQGWVAWMVEQAVNRAPFSICGNGKQVRDVLHISDLIRCYQRIASLSDGSPAWGEAFNIGGGPANSLSILELFASLAEHHFEPVYSMHSPRPADQKVFVANISKAARMFDWTPSVPVERGLDLLLHASLPRTPRLAISAAA